MQRRKILYLDGSETTALSEGSLREAGWEPCVVRSTAQAREVVDREDVFLGLVSLAEADAQFVGDLEDLLVSSRTMAWVALVTADCLQGADVRRLLLGCCYDYHRVPVDLPRLKVTLGHAHGMASLRSPPPRPQRRYSTYQMIGESQAMRRLYRDMEKIASVEDPIVIAGESGTGKELTAVAIHKLSRRAHRPFVVVNCGSVGADSTPSELFGQGRGAFAGPHGARVETLAEAHGGTILLDDIGDLPQEFQVGLLRFLQASEAERTGGKSSVGLDARVMATTRMDLERAVVEGRLRPELYYRLGVMRVDVPPLRDRAGDVGLLARFFLDAFGQVKGRRVTGLSRMAERAMARHDWPGNVRELLHRVRRAKVMCDGGLISPADLGLREPAQDRLPTSLSETRAAAEREGLCRTLAATGGNVSESARHLGVSRVTLYRLMEKHGLGT